MATVVVGEKLRRRWGRTSHVGHRALWRHIFQHQHPALSSMSVFVNTTIPGAGHINAPDSHSPKGKKREKKKENEIQAQVNEALFKRWTVKLSD